ncbi:MAG: hypothetical protein SXQ77_04790 [Halobacteria archaeon]|nr:hypothetical protein [Halobacteria archaeon]
MKPKISTLVLVVLVSAVLVSLVAVGGVGASHFVPSSQISVEGYNVTPGNPAPGDTVLITVTIRCSEESSSPVTIDRVSLRKGSGYREKTLESYRNIGTLSAGGSTKVTLSTEVGSAGLNRYTVEIDGHGENRSDIEIDYPVSVLVDDTKPSIELPTEDLVAGHENEFSIEVSNGRGSSVRNVVLELNSNLVQKSKSAPKIGGGETKTFNFSVTPAENGSVGTHVVEARLTYKTGTNNQHTVTESGEIEVVGENEKVMGAEVVLTGVRVQSGIGGMGAPSQGMGAGTGTGVGAGGTRSVAGVLHITGSASNVGLEDAQGTVVSVVDTQGVTPVAPNKNYFVGLRLVRPLRPDRAERHRNTGTNRIRLGRRQGFEGSSSLHSLVPVRAPVKPFVGNRNQNPKWRR